MTLLRPLGVTIVLTLALGGSSGLYAGKVLGYDNGGYVFCKWAYAGGPARVL